MAERLLNRMLPRDQPVFCLQRCLSLSSLQQEVALGIYFSLFLLIHLWVYFSLMSDQKSQQIDVPREDWFLLAPVQLKAAVESCVDGWVGFLSKGRKNSPESLRDMLHPPPP